MMDFALKTRFCIKNDEFCRQGMTMLGVMLNKVLQK